MPNVKIKVAELFQYRVIVEEGKQFNIYKFRSMVTDAEELKVALLHQNEATGPVFKMKDDPRVTKVGRFIRKTSLDELPQLVNVLKGEMSLVGPRPPLLDEVGMAVNKGNEDFIEKVNEALSDMKEDGTYKEIYKKWFGSDPVEQ